MSGNEPNVKPAGSADSYSADGPLRPIKVGLCGFFQSGKSMLINCLLGQEAALSGEGMATTRWTTRYQFAETEQVVFKTEREEPVAVFRQVSDYLACVRKLRDGQPDRLDERLESIRFVDVLTPRRELRGVILVDTPGFGHDDFDDRRAEAAVQELDVIFFVQPNGTAIGDCERKFLAKIAATGRPAVLLQNCKEMSRWCPQNAMNRKHEVTNYAELKRKGVTARYSIGDSASFNFIWHWFGAIPEKRLAPETLGCANGLTVHFPGWDATPDGMAQQMIERSRVPEIQRFVFTPPERSVGVNAYCLGTLHRAAEHWSQAAVQQIQQLKKTVAN